MPIGGPIQSINYQLVFNGFYLGQEYAEQITSKREPLLEAKKE
jgi:hypothetical protein